MLFSMKTIYIIFMMNNIISLNLNQVSSDIKKFEGLRLYAYKDAHGKSIGYGCFLNRKWVKEYFGKRYKQIYEGKIKITKEEAEILFKKDLNLAIKIARLYIDGKFDKLHPTAQRVLVNMTYNLGSRIYTFKKMKRALLKFNYKQAAEEMKNSKWYYQVGKRAKFLYKLMKGINNNN